eukprot:1732966-Alexandrium_andersonii.AAC.1
MEMWKAKFVEAEARNPVVAGEFQEPPERATPVPSSKSSFQKKAPKSDKKGRASASAQSLPTIEDDPASEAAAGAAGSSEMDVAVDAAAAVVSEVATALAIAQSEGMENTESMTGGPAPA